MTKLIASAAIVGFHLKMRMRVGDRTHMYFQSELPGPRLHLYLSHGRFCSTTGVLTNRTLAKHKLSRWTTIDGSPSQHSSTISKPSRKRHKPLRRVHTRALLSQASFGYQDEQLTIAMDHGYLKLDGTEDDDDEDDADMQNPIRVISTTFLSLVSTCNPTSSHTRIATRTMLSVSGCNMMFNFQLGRPASDRNNVGSLNLNCSIVNACAVEFVVNWCISHFSGGGATRLLQNLHLFALARGCEPRPRSSVSL